MKAFFTGFEKRAEETEKTEETKKPLGLGPRRFGYPRSEDERKERHGSSDLPPRGTGLKKSLKDLYE